jgi:hypothetical protein
MSESSTSKSLFQFIGQPFSFYFGVTAITSILFLDTYLLFNGSSVQTLSKDEYSSTGQVLIFFLCYFLCLHILTFPFRMACYIIFLLILQAIDKWKNTSFTSLICEYESGKGRQLKSQYSLLADAVEEKNSVKYNLYADCVAKEKTHVSLQNILFALAVLLPINFYHDQSILRIFGYKPDAWGLVVLASLVLLWVSIYQRDFKIYVPEPFSLEMKTKN